MSKATLDHAKQSRTASPAVRNRGRPIADLLAKIESRNPELAKESGLSSAALRAADIIRGLRTAKGFTQSELGRAVGVSQERISELERGVGPQGPTFELMDRIARACDSQMNAVATAAQEVANAIAAKVVPAEVLSQLDHLGVPSQSTREKAWQLLSRGFQATKKGGVKVRLGNRQGKRVVLLEFIANERGSAPNWFALEPIAKLPVAPRKKQIVKV